jgi:hypothetical protein
MTPLIPHAPLPPAPLPQPPTRAPPTQIHYGGCLGRHHMDDGDLGLGDVIQPPPPGAQVCGKDGMATALLPPSRCASVALGLDAMSSSAWRCRRREC